MKQLIHKGLFVGYMMFFCTSVWGQNHVTEHQEASHNYAVALLSLNSTGTDISPAFYSNGLVFSSNRQAPIWSGVRTGQGDFGLYYSKQRGDAAFKTPKKLRGAINSIRDEGAITVTNDQKQIYFSRPRSKKQKATVGIFYAQSNDGKTWKKIVPFEHNLEGYNVAHPALSSDNQRLYFVSDLPGGYGGTDIYVCYWENEKWSPPINLGGNINTDGNELFPFIHEDGTLYFSSNGHKNSLGGFDIWCATPLDGDYWKRPQQLPHPLNSSADDFGLILTKDKSTGYFVSNRKGGIGNDDIYACIQVSETNEFDINQALLLNSMIDMKPTPFPSNHWKLSQTITQELDKLVGYLKNNPGIIVEIGAHTDANGDAAFNLELSTERARAASQYLLAKGVAQKQVQYKGYGETKILNDCLNGIPCTEQEHKVNNRLEARVVETDVNVLVKNAQKRTDKKAVSENTLVGNGHQLHYQVEVGPFNQINNRVFYECRNVNANIDIESTPIGQLMILGPYESQKAASQHQTEIQQLGIQKARIQTAAHQQLVAPHPSTNAITTGQYEVELGPYKEINSNLYLDLVKTGVAYIQAAETNKGIILKLGAFSNRKDAVSLAKKVNWKGKRSKVVSRK